MNYRHIKELRIDADKKQWEIAKHLGVVQNTYSKYENGVIEWTAPLLEKLADFYGTSVDYLIDRTDEKKPYSKMTRGKE
ncbi:helix-turn-helix domain-containing protein [Candidatus Soleaferrea massiliensis]|uniref:helix-turn-helix domain-containing protein n=1 Tax=Candidatus Soleaferrea massiliensis TaxID=1470354 RepID=UPI00058B64A7|nr:helix-turn-helix transcriptional regulator [Candidatus Soleaferrea massiliensis]